MLPYTKVEGRVLKRVRKTEIIYHFFYFFFLEKTTEEKTLITVTKPKININFCTYCF